MADTVLYLCSNNTLLLIITLHLIRKLTVLVIKTMTPIANKTLIFLLILTLTLLMMILTCCCMLRCQGDLILHSDYVFEAVVKLAMAANLVGAVSVANGRSVFTIYTSL